MAQTQQQTPSETPNGSWAAAAARCGYAIHNGVPVIGIAPDEGDGYIVPVPAPNYFGHITDSGLQENVFRAVAAHALRVGQQYVKAEKSPTREHAEKGVHAAVHGTYKPKSERTSDILDSEANRMFANHVRGLVLTKAPEADEAAILATIAKQADTNRGKELIAKFRGEVATRGTYKPNRKGASKAGAVDLDL